MKKKLFLLFNCLTIGICLSAQSTNLSHISTSGAVSESASISLQWTLGETFSGTSASDAIVLTKGFLQPILQVRSIAELEAITRLVPENDVNIQVWPNPATAELNVSISNVAQKGIMLHLFDLSGKRVVTKQLDTAFETSVINLGDFQPGEYIMKFIDAEDQHLRSFMITKI